MTDISRKPSKAKVYEPLHRQREALNHIADKRSHEILGETIEAITASVAANFWLLVVQRLAPMIPETGSMHLHLSENFGEYNIYASGLMLEDVLEAATTQETADHLRNQVVVGICCALENSFTQLSNHLGASMANQSPGIESKPVRRWSGIRDLYLSSGGHYSLGFQDDCLGRLQNLFWARNRIVHHNAKWSEVLVQSPTFWKKADKVLTDQNTVDTIVQWIDNELLHSWKDLDAVLSN